MLNRSCGGFWFDRAPAELHHSFAGTSSSAAEYDALWNKCAEWTGWQVRCLQFVFLTFNVCFLLSVDIDYFMAISFRVVTVQRV
jgi:hypothetical protein